MTCASIAFNIAASRRAVSAVSLTCPSRRNCGRNATGSASGVNQSFIHSTLALQILTVGMPVLG